MKPLAAVQSLTDILTTLEIDTAELARVGLRIAVIWGLAWVALRALRIVARRIVAAVDDGDPTTLTLREKRGQTIAQLIRGVGRVLIYLIALLLTLNIFIDIGPLLAGAGVAGLAISFGAQSLVKDVIAGFFILFEDQFAVGDIVEVGGKSGVVERMTLRSVTVRSLDGNIHMVPNGQITTVTNRTRGWARAVVEVGIAYHADVDRALAVFRDEARLLARDGTWRTRLTGEPEVAGVEQLAESAVVIRTLFLTGAGDQWDVAREFRRRIKNRLDREGIEIPFPQRTVHLRQDGGVAVDPPGAA
jgi:small conductance mechanosensitive channel